MNIVRYNLIVKALNEIKEIMPMLVRASSNFLFKPSLDESIKKIDLIKKLLVEANQEQSRNH
jgi:hypothetical protein